MHSTKSTPRFIDIHNTTCHLSFNYTIIVITVTFLHHLLIFNLDEDYELIIGIILPDAGTNYGTRYIPDWLSVSTLGTLLND